MNKFTLIIGTVAALHGAHAAEDSATVLIGNIPGQYVGKDKNSLVLGVIRIEKRVIKEVKAISKNEISDLLKTASMAVELKNKSGAKAEILSRVQAAGGSVDHDVIYPGLINLHNHTKQNNLPIWSAARGQFQNRFEWREWGGYKKAVSGNMNPWVDFAKPVECATFRWSELQALVMGTLYLQGPSTCVGNFAVHRVEDASAYISKKAAIQAPTDVVIPGDMTFVWKTLKPLIDADAKKDGFAYERALTKVINQYCPDLGGISVDGVSGKDRAQFNKLKDQDTLKKGCKAELPEKFVRYIYFVHPTIVGKKAYLLNPKRAAVIAHLAEGRRDDPYNKKEFEILKLLGLDLPNINFVHGVGIDKAGFAEMAKKDMGLIWSPFSNMILYNQTLDIKAAHEAGVVMAIGSDWVPTGTKSVLEEVKIARSYVEKDADKEGLRSIFTDEYLYKMMTENPARLINHWSISPSEAGVGQIAKGAMGSVIAVSLQHFNPFTNLVEYANEKHINLAVIDGKVIYGNVDYLKAARENEYEELPVDSDDYSALKNEKDVPKPSADVDKAGHLKTLARYMSKRSARRTDNCKFENRKGLVHQNSLNHEEELKTFKDETGLNLDRVEDLTKLLAINLMTQSRNLIDPKEGDPKFAISYFPPLYSCNDPLHVERTYGFIDNTWLQDRANREKIREEQKHERVPKGLALDFK